MKKLFQVIDRLLLVWCLVVTAMLTVSVILSVGMRYLLGITFVWSEEFITMLFIATTFFGAALAMKDQEHIRINSLTDAFPKKVQTVVNIVGLLITVGVMLVLFHRSLDWIAKAGDLVTPGLRLPERYFYYMVPVSSILIIFYSIRRVVILLGGRADPLSQRINDQTGRSR